MRISSLKPSSATQALNNLVRPFLKRKPGWGCGLVVACPWVQSLVPLHKQTNKQTNLCGETFLPFGKKTLRVLLRVYYLYQRNTAEDMSPKFSVLVCLIWDALVGNRSLIQTPVFTIFPLLSFTFMSCATSSFCYHFNPCFLLTLSLSRKLIQHDVARKALHWE